MGRSHAAIPEGFACDGNPPSPRALACQGQARRDEKEHCRYHSTFPVPASAFADEIPSPPLLFSSPYTRFPNPAATRRGRESINPNMRQEFRTCSTKLMRCWAGNWGNHSGNQCVTSRVSPAYNTHSLIAHRSSLIAHHLWGATGGARNASHIWLQPLQPIRLSHQRVIPEALLILIIVISKRASRLGSKPCQGKERGKRVA
ncbi:hypothetical protein F5X98DRAFT_335967 [Xylaria grammica]|nr:hypothetical protein F5X98DRAFT_335967 [Xylaria grammica]